MSSSSLMFVTMGFHPMSQLGNVPPTTTVHPPGKAPRHTQQGWAHSTWVMSGIGHRCPAMLPGKQLGTPPHYPPTCLPTCQVWVGIPNHQLPAPMSQGTITHNLLHHHLLQCSECPPSFISNGITEQWLVVTVKTMTRKYY